MTSRPTRSDEAALPTDDAIPPPLALAAEMIKVAAFSVFLPGAMAGAIAIAIMVAAFVVPLGEPVEVISGGSAMVAIAAFVCAVGWLTRALAHQVEKGRAWAVIAALTLAGAAAFAITVFAIIFAISLPPPDGFGMLLFLGFAAYALVAAILLARGLKRLPVTMRSGRAFEPVMNAPEPVEPSEPR